MNDLTRHQRNIVGEAAIRYLRTQGILLFVMGNKLRAAPLKKITPRIEQLILRCRREIIEALDGMVE